MQKRNIHLIIAAFLFGILVWLSVTMREEYTVAVQAPLDIVDIPEGWAVKTPLPSNLTLRLRSDGWRLAAVLLGPEIRLTFAFPEIEQRSQFISAADVADRISLRSGVLLADVKPDSVLVQVDRLVTRKVPVALDASLSFRDGYGQVGGVQLDPDSVSIGGAESVVRQLKTWPTSRMSFDDLRAPLDARVPLAPSGTYQLALSASSVRVAVNVQPFAEKILPGLSVDVRDVPAAREVILIPPKIEVVVRGGIRQLATLSPSDIHVEIDYSAILADSSGVIETRVATPEGIQVVQKRPDRLQYIVRKRL